MPDEPAEVALPGGRMTSGLVLRGGELRRPTGPWSAAVHEYLRHLESVGFAGSPRLLRVDGDREVLTFLDGEVPVDPDWEPGRDFRVPSHARTDRALAGAARLVRDLHRAAAGFRPTVNDYRFHPHPPRAGEVVSHGDLGPWNTVYRDGLPVAFIDWDAAQPVDPVVELASAAWAYVPLSPGQLREADLAGRLRLFVDAYGLADRLAIIPALRQAKLRAAEQIGYWNLGAADSAAALEFLAGQLRSLEEITPALRGAL